MQVAETTVAALGDEGTLAVDGKIGDDFSGLDVGEHGADRNPQLHVVAALAVAVGTAAVLAFFCLERARIAIVDQRVEIAVSDGPDAAALAAVTAVRPAEGNELFAPK